MDDVADNRELYGIALALAGFDVESAATAEAGLAMAFARPPDIVIMDFTLPGIDGCEATRILKADARTAFVSVIIVTGTVVAAIESLIASCGADDFHTKPLTPSALVIAIEKVLGKR